MIYIFIALLFTPQESDLNIKHGIAIQGYDPLSYFSNKPQKGSDQFTAQFKEATYYFVSEANKQKFIKNPEMYEPQYGGWCAYAMGVDGTKVKIDPETFKIVDGKLYLFYNFLRTNTLPLWNENELNLKTKADQFWMEVVKN